MDPKDFYELALRSSDEEQQGFIKGVKTDILVVELFRRVKKSEELIKTLKKALENSEK